MIIGHKKGAEAITATALTQQTDFFNVTTHYPQFTTSGCYQPSSLLAVIRPHSQPADEEIILKNEAHVTNSGSAA